MLASMIISIAALGLASVSAQTCSRNATVQANDTCDSISNLYAVSTYQLALVNADAVNSNCTNLEIGQDLCLGWKGEDCSKVYVVLAGDTCDGISSKYGLADGTLSANNPQIDDECFNIYSGEVLCVDTTAYTYGAASANASTVAVPTAVATATATSSGVSSLTVLQAAAVQSSSTSSASTASATGTADDEEDDEDCDDDDDDADDDDDDADDDEDFCDDDDDDCETEDDDDLPYCDDL